MHVEANRKMMLTIWLTAPSLQQLIIFKYIQRNIYIINIIINDIIIFDVNNNIRFLKIIAYRSVI